jgi:hypothetical protein
LKTLRESIDCSWLVHEQKKKKSAGKKKQNRSMRKDGFLRIESEKLWNSIMHRGM